MNKRDIQQLEVFDKWEHKLFIEELKSDIKKTKLTIRYHTNKLKDLEGTLDYVRRREIKQTTKQD